MKYLYSDYVDLICLFGMHKVRIHMSSNLHTGRQSDTHIRVHFVDEVYKIFKNPSF